jgi:hypothetical protein
MKMQDLELEKYIELSSIPLRSFGSNNMPTGCASACIFRYDTKRLLLTVFHATGNGADWGIQVGFDPEKGTAIQPLKGMYFLKSIKMHSSEIQDIDFAFVEIPNDIVPVSQQINPDTGTVLTEVSRLDSKISFNVQPSTSETYGFSGQVMAELKGNSLITQLRTYTGLKYVGDEDDCHVFELPFVHPGHEHFQGCSGAPIIDTKGNVVALVCRGDVASNRLYGVSLQKYEIAINVSYGSLSKAI